MVDGFCKPFEVPEHQAVAVLDQADPVNGTYYTVLDTTEHCRLISVSGAVMTTGEDIEIRITIDGNVMETGNQAAVAGTNYWIYFRPRAASQDEQWVWTASDPNAAARAFLAEARSIKVEIRKNSAAGVGNLRAAVSYAKW